MADFATFTPKLWMQIREILARYAAEGDDDPEQNLGQRIRNTAARQHQQGWDLYLRWLTEILGDHVANPHTIAEVVMQALFVWTRGDDEPCVCSCHPRLITGDLHGFGFECHCGKTPEERTQAWDRTWQELQELWDTPEHQAWQAAEDAARDEANAWLDAQPDVRDMRQLSAACPEQWQGIVADRPFYFRERHGHWQIKVGDDLVPGTEPVHHVDTEYVKGFTSYYDTSTYTAIAEGVDTDLGSGIVAHVQFIIGTIRGQLRQQSCAHVHAEMYAYCPECGIRMMDA